MRGQIIKSTGSWYLVKTDDLRRVNCKVKGSFKLKGIRSTNPVAVGDIVEIIENNDGTAFITEIAQRKNYIIRRASNLSKESHIIATNLDQALLVATLDHPVTSTTFIDRFLATAEAYSVKAVIAINKTDLLTDKEDQEYLDAFCYLYNSIGYDLVRLSAKTGQGMETLREMLKGKLTLLSGNSGVGKSSIINRLIPGLNLRTASISTSHDTGTHTTTFSEMFSLPGGGEIIDTPGIKEYGTIEHSKQEDAQFFPKKFKISRNCRYYNCTHTHEPGCAVIEALNNNLIAQSRYNSYLSLLGDSQPDKYRKPY